MELYLIRHAEPVLARGIRENGRPADPVLSARGREQAASLAHWLRGESIDALCVSPLRRALETASPVARALGLEQTVIPGLAEFDAEATSYIPLEELRRTGDPRLAAMVEGRWDEIGVDLDLATFAAGVIETVEWIIEQHPGERVAAVCHGGIINIYLAHVVGIERSFWFEPTYTSVSRVAAARSGVRTILTVNENGHLRQHDLGSRP